MRASDTDMGVVAAKYLDEFMGVTKLGIIYNNDDYGNGARGVIVDYLEKNTDVEVLVQEGHNTGDKDLTGALVKVRDAGCDGMIVWAHEQEAGVACRQYSELGLEDAGVKLLGGPIWGMGSLYAIIDDALINGQKGVMEYSVNNEDPISKAFTEAYKAKFGIDAISMSANWYDGAYILFKALELCGEDFSRENVKANLPLVDFEGVTSHVFLGENGYDFIHRAYIGEVKAENNVKIAINMEKVDTATK
jgi:branched-chain amino acid transport system substrate-binding protein